MDSANTPEVTPEMLAENPVLMVSLFLFFGLFIAFLAGSLGSWILIFVRLIQRKTVLVTRNWSPRVWGLADVLLAITSLLLIQSLFVSLGVRWLGVDLEALQAGEDPPLAMSALIGSSYVVGALVAGLWILVRFQVGPSHIGLTTHKLPRVLLTGLIAGLATLPVVFMVGALVTLGFDTEYEHPVIDGMKKEGTLGSYLMACFAATIAAPIAEEFLFRVLLQGWLQSIPFSTPLASVLGAPLSRRKNPADALYFHPASGGSSDETSEPSIVNSAPESSTEYQDTATLANTSDSPYRPTDINADDFLLRASQSEQSDESSATQPTLVPPLWPAILVGILFGLAHWGYGLSFVPLTVLGIVLGLLYRATQSIWPCILVHFMLNSSSMLALGIQVLIARAAGGSS